MPYDLFISEQDHDALHTEWEFVGTYAKLHAVQDALTYQGYTRPELRRWTLMYVRRATGMLGKMHSMGDYPQKEE